MKTYSRAIRCTRWQGTVESEMGIRGWVGFLGRKAGGCFLQAAQNKIGIKDFFFFFLKALCFIERGVQWCAGSWFKLARKEGRK